MRKQPAPRVPHAVTLRSFAIAAPGLAPLLAEELRELGLTPTDVSDAGVSFESALEGIFRANLHSRIASRVVVRLAEFKAAHFSQLEAGTQGVEWPRWIAPGAQVALRVTCKKSRLYHSGAVAERVLGVVSQAVKGVTGARVTDDEEPSAGQLILVRIDHDQCTLSLDSSGELLHRRGYRQAVARAPLRETLAAAMLRGAQWRGDTPLTDPMCGSGTLPIEAALVARGIAPGISRAFVFAQWPMFEPAVWKRVVSEARANERAQVPVPIAGSDRDAGAIEAAIANAERAGVAGDIVFTRQALSQAAPSDNVSAPGLLIANPPWGERVGDAKALRDLYASFGHLARGSFQGWSAALLTSSQGLRNSARVDWRQVFTTSAGGIRVAFSVAAGQQVLRGKPRQ